MGGEEISQSIEETNKLRKELGLKPLKVDKDKKEKDAPKKGSSKAPVDYWEEQQKEDKRKKKDKEERKKRLREESNLEKGSSKDIYKSGPKIHEAVDDEPDDAVDWIAQHRLKKHKTEKERRRKESSSVHDGDDLSGMHISHDMERFQEGEETTLILADTPLLTKDGELNVDRGELENVDWKDKSRIARNKEIRSQKAGYDPAGVEESECSFGVGGLPKRALLSKYDEVPERQEEGFTLGEAPKHEIDPEAESKLAELTRDSNKQSLSSAGPLRFQKDYLPSEDKGFQVGKFKSKKPKKRKLVKDDEDKPPVIFKTLERPADCDSDEEDPELYESLRKQRRGIAQRHAQVPIDESTKGIIQIVNEQQTTGDDARVTITGTTQFCKSVETAVEKVESLKSETFQGASMYKSQQQLKRKQMRGVRVSKPEKEKDDDKVTAETKAAIEQDSEEEDAGMGEAPLDMTIGSALEYLRSRDQLKNDQDTCRMRNKDHRPLETSTEDGDIKLEYRDKFGRVQNPKEAFRTISWKFHGKLPGHKNYERRLQCYEREMMLRKRDGTELPTQRALSAIQKAENKPHMVLGAEK